jgi:hypothetical protein
MTRAWMRVAAPAVAVASLIALTPSPAFAGFAQNSGCVGSGNPGYTAGVGQRTTTANVPTQGFPHKFDLVATSAYRTGSCLGALREVGTVGWNIYVSRNGDPFFGAGSSLANVGQLGAGILKGGGGGTYGMLTSHSAPAGSFSIFINGWTCTGNSCT